MANTPKIKSFKQVVPMIYAYNTPGVAYHEGWTKVGYTEKQTVDKRIKQQTHTADIQYVLAWQDNAMYKDGSGEYFTDHDFHAFLEADCEVERTPGTEWFKQRADVLRTYFDAFARRETVQKEEEKFEYALRDEQKQAVEMTKAYFENGGEEFLWNAKPRFGKTLTTYDLIRQMGFKNVLIVTNRPSIANSWAEDFRKFIGWRGELSFVSETDALRGKPGVLSREGYLKAMHARGLDSPFGMVAFESLQGLKGSVYFGGQYDKLAWMAKEYSDEYGKKQHGMQFDLLVIDEAQEGVDTMRTDRAFRNIAMPLANGVVKAKTGNNTGATTYTNWYNSVYMPTDVSGADVSLSALSIGSVSLSPTFDKDVTAYTATTSNATNTVTATATDSDASVVITLNGNSITSGSSVTWRAGANTVMVTVRNGGSSRTYTVAVTAED